MCCRIASTPNKPVKPLLSDCCNFLALLSVGWLTELIKISLSFLRNNVILQKINYTTLTFFYNLFLRQSFTFLCPLMGFLHRPQCLIPLLVVLLLSSPGADSCTDKSTKTKSMDEMK